MKLGVFSFNTEYSIRPDELAIAAEERGYESVWFPEHTHIPASRQTEWPAGGELPKEYIHMCDPLVSAAAAAVVTKHIIVGTSICLINEHDTMALAKAVATVDYLANGRFEFGVGAGWNVEEMVNHGVQFEERWAVLEDRLLAMKALWTQDESTYHGKYENFDKVWSYPKPVSQPHPPILVGTLASAFGRKKVAQLGDGWIPVGSLHGGTMGDDIADLHDKLREEGRDPESVPVSVFDIFETPIDDLKRLAELGTVYRAIPRCPTEDRDTVLRWLDKYAVLIDEFDQAA